MSSNHKASMITGYGDLPFGEFSQLTEGGVGVLGVPTEMNHGPRFGTALAPDALRKVSHQLDLTLPVKGCDLGNLSLAGDWSTTLAQMLPGILSKGTMPVVLGGATDVALAVLRALPDAPVVAALPQVRSELTARAAPTTWLGLNGEQAIDIWCQLDQRGMEWRTARQLDEGSSPHLVGSEQAVLWIDMSVIDLGHAAGVIGLNPGGIKPQTLVSVVEHLACRWQSLVVRGMAPNLDTRGMTELVAIETINAALHDG